MNRVNRNDPEIYGIPPDQSIRHGVRIYALTVLFTLIALVQWLLVFIFTDFYMVQSPPVLYGAWVMGTFFAICALAWTNFGRTFPVNLLIIATIVESSTMFIALEQMQTKSLLVDTYAIIIVVALVVAIIFWGAYFPMRLVPGDLMLSLLVAIANIVILMFFINAFLIGAEGMYKFTRYFFATLSVMLIMYTATVIHDRQFDVPKNEYLFLSVLLFFGYMLLHERLLNMTSNND